MIQLSDGWPLEISVLGLTLVRSRHKFKFDMPQTKSRISSSRMLEIPALLPLDKPDGVVQWQEVMDSMQSTY